MTSRLLLVALALLCCASIGQGLTLVNEVDEFFETSSANNVFFDDTHFGAGFYANAISLAASDSVPIGGASVDRDCFYAAQVTDDISQVGVALSPTFETLTIALGNGAAWVAVDYDGSDGTPTTPTNPVGPDPVNNPTVTGLNSSTFFTDQNAVGMTFRIQADHAVRVELHMYEQGNTNPAVGIFNYPEPAPGTRPPLVAELSYNLDFTPSINFSNIGALRILVFTTVATDFDMDTFFTFTNEISGRVYVDCNESFDDESEAAVPAYPVQLFECGSSIVFDSTTTDSQGNYVFGVTDTLSGLPACYDVCIDTTTLSPNALIFEPNLAATTAQTCYTNINTFDSSSNDFGVTQTSISCSTANLDCSDNIGVQPSNVGDAGTPIISTLGPCNPSFTFTDNVIQPGTCAGQTSRVFTTTDTNAATCTQTIFVTDSAGPVLSTAPSATVSIDCQADTSVAANGEPTFTDVCNGPATVLLSPDSISPLCPGTEQIVRVWQSVDQCDISGASFTQTITTTDTTNPIVVAPPDFTGPCNSVVNVGVPTGTDNCASTVTFTGTSFTDSAISNGPCGQSFVRTWIGQDGCLNTGTDTQLITLADTQPPSITAPADTTVSCNESTAEGAPNIGTFSGLSDDCTTPTVLPATDVVNVVDPCLTIITRTWIAQDTCSTTSDTTVSQQISVVDNILPTLIIPASQTIDCLASTAPTGILGFATATDDCQGTLQTTFSDSAPVGTTCLSTITRTWSVNDNCAGLVSEDQFILLDDNSPPTFVVPASDFSLDCADDSSVSANGSPTSIADDCSTPNPPVSSDTIVSDGCSRTITRRWTVDDICGNTSPAQIQTLVFTDTTAPTVFAPSQSSLECGSDSSPAALGFATATDDCNTNVINGITTPVFLDSLVGDSCSTTVTRTWTVSDGCQVGSSVQTIVINDTIPPVITIPSPEEVELCTCGLNCGTPAAAVDACQGTPASFTSTDAGPSPGPCGPVARTWTAVDSCGLSSTATQTITFVDSTPPVYQNNLISPFSLECGADTSSLATGIAQFSDCSNVVVTMVDATVFADDCTQQYQRSFFGTNECGGQSVFTQDINVSDTVAPTFDFFPATATVECNTSTDPVDTGGIATASDACQPPANVVVTFSDTESTINACLDQILRSWTASDVCGRSRTQVQTINVEDSLPPTIIMPRNVVTECTGGAPSTYSTASFGTATGTDSCSPANIVGTFVDDAIIGGTSCSGTFGRTWTVVDDCGRATTDTQQFVINDTTAPLFATFPGSAAVDCGASSNPSLTGEPTVTEVCNSFTLTFSDGSVSGSCPGTFVRTWSVDDGCNPPTVSVQIISVNDSVMPTFTGFPSDDNTLQCGDPTDPSSTGAPGSTDSCTTASVPTFLDNVVVTGNNCIVTISRTWSTTDSCGNTRTQVQVLTSRDTIAPPVATFPVDSSIECGSPLPGPSATVGPDACSPGTETVVVSGTSQTSTDCTQIFTRTYVFADSCGNSFPRTETVTIVDTTVPTIGTVPPTTVDCDDPRPVVFPAVSDCNNIPTVTFTDVETSNNCPNDVITRTFTAEDWCGLTSQSTTTITVTNNLPPVVAAPPDEIVECGDSSDPSQTGTATAAHPCQLGFTITFSDSSNGGDSCSELITRTWSASDICGNTGTDVQILDISDNIEPDFTCFPDDATVLCSESTDPFNTGGFPCATDECQGVVCQITFFDSAPTELTPIGDCPGDLQYTRTWVAMDACGLDRTENQVITVIFHEQAEDCPAEPCVAAPCELCECPVEPPCNCCAMGGITACSAVPCNAVECTAVPCTAVDCEPCPPSSGTTASPVTACGPEVPCIPNLRFVHNNDDGDGEQLSTYVVDFDNLSRSINDDDNQDDDNQDYVRNNDDEEDDDSASQLAGGILAVILPIMILLLLN